MLEVSLTCSRNRRILGDSFRGSTRVENWRFNGREETSRVRDLSPGGLFVEKANPTAVGASARLHFRVQERPIGAEAVVRHVNLVD
jgi:hypothetical protein